MGSSTEQITPGQSNSVVILMALYNGGAHLQDQLDSFTTQSVSDWDLIVGDDGSGDAGPEMIRSFADAQHAFGHRVTLCAGPGRGVAANFLSLLAQVPENADWVALSDQDDVWLPDRLAQGQAALAAVPPTRPALFGSATLIVDEDLTGHRQSPRFSRPPGFRNALVQSIAGGNTMLLNRAGAALARAAAREVLAGDALPETHDWWLYQLISGVGGHVVRSEVPTLLYRQHGGNLFGSNRGIRASLRRAVQLASGDLATWTARNARALMASADRLTPENRVLLTRFSTLRTQHVVSRIRTLHRLGLYRQGRIGQAALWVAAVFGRL